MQPQASQRSDTEREDELVQGAVLALLLREHPTQLTDDDLALEVGQDDATRRATADLIAVGLLRRDGGSVLPTRAALRFDQLEAR